MLVNEVAGLADAFRSLCQDHGVVYEPAVRRDMLAATLSSQLVLFAGPSGTGKSTAARMLARFFTTEFRTRTVEVRPLWSGPEGLTGYYSRLTSTYDETPSLRPLVELGTATGGGVPFLILEEANLSPMEVYLGNVVTGLSGLAAEKIPWRLHWQSSPLLVEGMSSPLPPEFILEPFPRFLGTINVDSTAGAPSAKVCGRALVVLLEPPSTTLAISSIGAMQQPASNQALAAVAVKNIGAPSAAWWAFVAKESHTLLTDALGSLCAALEADLGAGHVSPREVQRSVMFMAWHVAIAEHDADFVSPPTAAREAAELAVLHVVLPGLGPSQFGAAVESLRTHATPGGILADRLARISSTKGLYGAPADFWAALS